MGSWPWTKSKKVWALWLRCKSLWTPLEGWWGSETKHWWLPLAVLRVKSPSPHTTFAGLHTWSHTIDLLCKSLSSHKSQWTAHPVISRRDHQAVRAFGGLLALGTVMSVMFVRGQTCRAFASRQAMLKRFIRMIQKRSQRCALSWLVLAMCKEQLPDTRRAIVTLSLWTVFRGLWGYKPCVFAEARTTLPDHQHMKPNHNWLVDHHLRHWAVLAGWGARDLLLLGSWRVWKERDSQSL